MADEIRVVMADDHPLIRRALRDVLEESGIVVLDEAADGRTALEKIERLRPDVAVLDIDMPGLSGLEVAGILRSRDLPVRIVFLSVHSDSDYLERALAADARGYVQKEGAVLDIVTAIRAVHEGRHYLSPALTTHLVAGRPGAARHSGPEDPIARLTPAEVRILRMIADLRTSKDIADELHIHYRTVENHRMNIAVKLDLRGSHALLRFALENRNRL